MKTIFTKSHPAVNDPSKVGTYPAEAFSGGGYFYDEVLEYRVWSKDNDSTTLHCFDNYDSALECSKQNKFAESPLVLIKQYEYIAEKEDNVLEHIKEQRITEWLPEWLEGAHDTKTSIPKLMLDRTKK